MKFRTSQSINELWDNFKQPNKLEGRGESRGIEKDISKRVKNLHKI